jgi:hypothetical protein
MTLPCLWLLMNVFYCFSELATHSRRLAPCFLAYRKMSLLIWGHRSSWDLLASLGLFGFWIVMVSMRGLCGRWLWAVFIKWYQRGMMRWQRIERTPALPCLQLFSVSPSPSQWKSKLMQWSGGSFSPTLPLWPCLLLSPSSLCVPPQPHSPLGCSWNVVASGPLHSHCSSRA